jgi:hypothetical protein
MRSNGDPQIAKTTQIRIGQIIAERRVGGASLATPGNRPLDIRTHVQPFKSV